MPSKHKSCSIRDLANHVGLSIGAVSRVLNNSSGFSISEHNRQRIITAARELNYVPNINARRLFQKKAHIIGLLVPSQTESENIFADLHFIDTLAGLEKPLTASEYNLLLKFNDPRMKANENVLELYRNGSVDGLLIWGAQYRDRYYRELLEHAAPHIFLNGIPGHDREEQINFISPDYEAAAYEMIRGRLRNGGRHMLYLAGQPTTQAEKEMTRGVNRAVNDSGGELTMRRCLYTPEAAATRMGQIIREGFHFDTVVLASAFMAHRLEDLMRDNQLTPNRFHWIVLDLAAREKILPWISSYATVDDIRIGHEAVTGLIDLVDGKRAGIQMKIPMRMIEQKPHQS